MVEPVRGFIWVGAERNVVTIDDGDVHDTPLDPTALASGTSVIVAGPAMSGKRRLLFDLLGGSPDDAGILITTKQDAETFHEGFLDTRPNPASWDLRIVDCVSKRRGVRDVRDSETVQYVTSTGDLTGIGITASGFMREFYHEEVDTRIGLHSLSTLLMYADLRPVYQFVHVLVGRVESSGFRGIFSMDTTGGDTEALETLSQVFDAMVEVRNTEDGRELRVRGGDFGPDTWTAF